MPTVVRLVPRIRSGSRRSAKTRFSDASMRWHPPVRCVMINVVVKHAWLSARYPRMILASLQPCPPPCSETNHSNTPYSPQSRSCSAGHPLSASVDLKPRSCWHSSVSVGSLGDVILWRCTFIQSAYRGRGRLQLPCFLSDWKRTAIEPLVKFGRVALTTTCTTSTKPLTKSVYATCHH